MRSADHSPKDYETEEEANVNESATIEEEGIGGAFSMHGKMIRS
jgi:hypothetical protein